MKRLLLIMCIALFSGNIYSQERLLAWQFSIDSRNTTGQELTHLATSLHPALSGSILKRGNGLAPASSTLARAFAAATNTVTIPTAGEIPTTQGDAETKNSYFEFEVSPRVGFKLALSEIRVNIRRTGTGHNKYIWKYSLNGGAFTELTPSTYEIAPNNPGGTLTADQTLDTGTPVYTNLSSISALQNLSGNDKLMLRLYVWGATALAGTSAFGRGTANDATYFPLAIHGTATPEVEKTLLGFDFANETGLQETFNATTVHSNIELSTLTRGAGLIPASSGIRHSIASNLKDFNEATNNRPTLNEAISQDDYYQVTVKAKPNNIVSLSSLDVTLRRSSIGAVNYQWRYSLDGSSFNDVVGGAGTVQFEATLGFAQPSVNLANVPQLQNVASGATVTLRLYVWGATGSTGGSISIGRYDNVGGTTTIVANSLAIGGTVSSVTPVKLTSFTAQNQGKSVVLKWATASETNNSHFEVLRSQGAEFKVKGTVTGSGNSNTPINYTYTDTNAPAGTLYYQLKQVDYNGDHELSKTVSVNNLQTIDQLTAYATTGKKIVNGSFYSDKVGEAQLAVIDLNGKIISQKTMLVTAGQLNQFEVPVEASTGVYILKLQLKGESRAAKFVIQ